MNKYSKIKALMKRTGVKKETAFDYLRCCQWDVEKAERFINLPKALDQISRELREFTLKIDEIERHGGG